MTASPQFNRESCKFWGPKTALLISKLYISEETKRSGISPSREFAGMYQGIGFRYQRCVQRAPCGGRTPETGSIDPGTCAGHAFLPIVEAILAGRQPQDLNFDKLCQGIPLSWVEQREQLGFSPARTHGPRTSHGSIDPGFRSSAPQGASLHASLITESYSLIHPCKFPARTYA